jgi:hypothetical protein
VSAVLTKFDDNQLLTKKFSSVQIQQGQDFAVVLEFNSETTLTLDNVESVFNITIESLEEGSDFSKKVE